MPTENFGIEMSNKKACVSFALSTYFFSVISIAHLEPKTFALRGRALLRL